MGLRTLLGLKGRPPSPASSKPAQSTPLKDIGAGELLSYYLNNPGRPIHRWLDNFPIYERHFARFRNAAPVVLEIGVKKGGSLDMWRHYFGPSATIIGVDVNQSCAKFRDDGFLIEIGDQADAEFWERFKQKYHRIDILIDDGGHRMDQQRVTFLSMFPHVSADGVYLCEDLHTSYWRHRGGGHRNPESFIEFCKRLIDELNQWQIRGHGLAPTDFTKSCAAMHFYTSVVVFEKSPRNPPRSAISKAGRLKYTAS